MAVLEASANRSAQVLSSPRTPVRDAARPPARQHPASASPRLLTPVACGHRRAPVPLSLVLVLAVAVCLAVVGLAVLANSAAGTPDVPRRTSVVRVEPGESLLQLAGRVAPGSDLSAVVDRIRELNGLTGSELRPGQPLTVPTKG